MSGNARAVRARERRREAAWVQRADVAATVGGGLDATELIRSRCSGLPARDHGPLTLRSALQIKKQAYDAKLCSYLDKYTKALVVHADNVGSNQLMMIRKARPRLATRRGVTSRFARAAGPCAPAAASPAARRLIR